MSKTQLKIITFTGKPGSGKSTIIKNVLATRPDMRIFGGKSVTTRLPRVGDVPGEYEHVSDAEFDALEKAGAFIWTAKHSGFQFGTRKRDVENALSAEHISVMTLVPDVVATLHRFAGSERVKSFFVVAEGDKALVRRIVNVRGAEDREKAERRLLETAMWAADMPCLRGVPVISVENKDESPPGKTATESVLRELVE